MRTENNCTYAKHLIFDPRFFFLGKRQLHQSHLTKKSVTVKKKKLKIGTSKKKRERKINRLFCFTSFIFLVLRTCFFFSANRRTDREKMKRFFIPCQGMLNNCSKVGSSAQWLYSNELQLRINKKKEDINLTRSTFTILKLLKNSFKLIKMFVIIEQSFFSDFKTFRVAPNCPQGVTVFEKKKM